jgi:hypothetical protein
MNKSESKANLAKIKIALAEKWERQAKITKSTPKRTTALYQAARARRQAADLMRP